MADHDADVTPARGVLLSESAAREVAAALDHLAKLAAPRGQQLSGRLRAIKRELLTSAASADTHAHASADGIVAQPDSHWEASVVDTATAARLLGITPGGAAWLCRSNRVRATRSAGRWLICTASLREYLDLRT